MIVEKGQGSAVAVDGTVKVCNYGNDEKVDSNNATDYHNDNVIDTNNTMGDSEDNDKDNKK